MTGKILTIEPSHGRPRVITRRPSDGGTPALPPPPAGQAAPDRDPGTGRFTAGNRAAQRRARVTRVRGVATLDPARCESWLAPHVRHGLAYAVALAERFPDPALARLVGDTSDAHVIYRALLALGAAGDAKALTEARAWLREHRSCLRELTALAAIAAEGADHHHDPLARFHPAPPTPEDP